MSSVQPWQRRIRCSPWAISPWCSWQVSRGMHSGPAWCLNCGRSCTPCGCGWGAARPDRGRTRPRSHPAPQAPLTGLPWIETEPSPTPCMRTSVLAGIGLVVAQRRSHPSNKGAPGHGRPGPLEPMSPWQPTAPRSWLRSAARRKGCRNPSGPRAIPFARLLPFLSALSALPAADGQLGGPAAPNRSTSRLGSEPLLQGSVVSPWRCTSARYGSLSWPDPAMQPGLRNAAAIAQVEEKHIRLPWGERHAWEARNS